MVKRCRMEVFSWENDDNPWDFGHVPFAADPESLQLLNPFMNRYYGMGYTSEVCEFGLVKFDIPFTHIQSGQ